MKLPYKATEWKTLLEMVWSIPLVPARRISEAIATVADAMMVRANTAELQERSQNYVRYLNQYWGRIPDILSVADTTTCTNNIAEGFYRQLPAKLGERHPALYLFLSHYFWLLHGRISSRIYIKQYYEFFAENMIVVIEESKQLWRQLSKGGMMLDQHRRNKHFHRDAAMRMHQDELKSNRFPMWEFLTQIFTNVKMNVGRVFSDSMYMNAGIWNMLGRPENF